MKIRNTNNRSCVGALSIGLVIVASFVLAGPASLSKAYASSTYVVQAGDTLYLIGLKFNLSWQSIASANNIVSPYTIYPGEVLVIPSPTPQYSSVKVSAVDSSNSALAGLPLVLSSGGSTLQVVTPATLQTTVGQTYTVTVFNSASYHFMRWADTGSTSSARTFTAGNSPSAFSAVFQAVVSYTVQPGDSLDAIGLKFNLSWQSIASANNIVSPYTIYPGEVLVIPMSAPTVRIATGNANYDQYDRQILSSSQKFSFPDPMIVKSMVMQESAFVYTAVSPDIPCGVPAGWTQYQSKSFGLMQVTPACIHPGTIPNLTLDQGSSLWATSWFNPRYNINQGTKALSGALSDMETKFPGCTANQYRLMAVGAYNSGEGSITGCGSWNTRADGYINTVLGHYQAFAQMANISYPY